MASQPITLTEQQLTDGTKQLKLLSPYHPDLPARARDIGGRWNAASKSWRFDVRDSDRVRALCLEVYGIDPLADPADGPELVTLRYRLGGIRSIGQTLWLFGRELAHQPGRDANARLGDGVVCVKGYFQGGGSRNNPLLNPTTDCVIEIRDIPRPLAEDEIRSHKSREQAAQERIGPLEGELAEVKARIAAFDDVEPSLQKGADLRRLDDERLRVNNLLASARIELDHVTDRLVIVQTAAADPVPAVRAQIAALFKQLGPDAQRAMLTSLLGELAAPERAQLLADLEGRPT